MFEGADYVMAEIIWWMAASAVVGFLLGWVVRRFFLARSHQRKLHAAEARIAELEGRLAEADDDVGGEDDRASPGEPEPEPSDDEDEPAAEDG